MSERWRHDRAHGQGVLQSRIEELLDELIIKKVDQYEREDVWRWGSRGL